MLLKDPAKYFPFMSGRFEVAAGLRPFGTDFGNGEADKKLIQLDKDFERYRSNKDECRKENIHKYCCTHRFDEKKMQVVTSFLSRKLAQEWPDHFQLQESGASRELHCGLTREVLRFDDKWQFLDSSQTKHKYLHAFDAICAQIQEDVALLSLETVEGRTKNYLSAVHLCAAGHWSPEEKIGKDFFAIHTPVPHIEKINERAQQFAEMMVTKGPFVRFVWGFSTDLRLNHHPLAPKGIDQNEWHGRSFLDPEKDKLFVRVERQVTWGLPEINSGLFTIRVSYLNGEDVKRNPEQRQKLLESLQSMSPESKVYKGVKTSFEVLTQYLS